MGALARGPAPTDKMGPQSMFTKDATVDLLPGQGKLSEDSSVIFIKQRRRGRPSDSRIVEAVSELGESKAGGHLQWAVVYTFLPCISDSN